MANYTIPIAAHQESTIDYPGVMGEILFVPGCNFKCGFCHNPELSQGNKDKVNLETLLKNIRAKANAGWYQGICISGGEPTIYPNLLEFAKKLKSYGLLVKLDTNGANPEMIEKLLNENLVDYIAMDIKTTREKYKDIVGVDANLLNLDKSIELVKTCKDYEFRTTVLPFMTEDDLDRVGKWITGGKGKVKFYTMQQFDPKHCLSPEYRLMKPKDIKDFNKYSELMSCYSIRVRVLGD